MPSALWKPAVLGLAAALAVLLLWVETPSAAWPIAGAAVVVMLTHSLHLRELARAVRAERRARVAEERYRDLFENVTDLIQSARPDGSFLYVNRAWRETLGYRDDEIAGLTIFDVLHPEALSECLDLFNRVMAGEQLDQIEVRFITRTGATLTAEGSVSCRFEDGKPVATRGIFHDISARKRVEEQLRLSEAHFQSLVESLPQCIFRKDADGRFTFASRRLCEMIGQPLEAILGKTDCDFFPPELADKYRADDRRVLDTGTPLEAIEEFQGKDRGRVHIQVVKVPLRDAAGRPLGIQGIFFDVTERVRAEEQLRHAKDAAESANRAKSDFLATVSHEIRTPMNGILGMTDLLLGTEVGARQRDYLDLMKLSAESLLAIINDLLDFAKIEAGRMELEASPFRLRESVRDVLRALAVRADEKALRLTWHVADDVPDALVGDKGRLAQVLINLVGNAIKFTEQGSVNVEVVSQEFTTEAQRHREDKIKIDGTANAVAASSLCLCAPVVNLCITVRDTGIGIPADKLTAIFEPFVQADNSMTRKYGGTGLGLAIVKRLVAIMGGTMAVESAPGLGSVFRFTARFERGGETEFVRAPSSLLPADGTRLGPLRVLVAEDNPINQTVARNLLEAWGHGVVIVGDGGLAAEAAARERFDVVLMDVRMPGVDGFEGTARIRAAERMSGGRLPIIALTAQAMQGDRERCLGAGFDAYLSKPIRSDELRRALAEVVQADCFAASIPRALENSALAERSRLNGEPPAFDRDLFLANCRHNVERRREIVGLFRGEVPRWSGELAAALTRGDARLLEETGHTIKGATGQFGGAAVSAAARRLEEIGRAGDLSAAAGAVTELSRELERFLTAIDPPGGLDGA